MPLWPFGRIDTFFALRAALSTRLSTLEAKVDRLMAIQDDVIAAVKAEKDEAAAAVLALQGLEAEVASLKAQAASGVDPAVLTQAIADLGTSTAALAAAIPAAPASPAGA